MPGPKRLTMRLFSGTRGKAVRGRQGRCLLPGVGLRIVDLASTNIVGHLQKAPSDDMYLSLVDDGWYMLGRCGEQRRLAPLTCSRVVNLVRGYALPVTC